MPGIVGIISKDASAVHMVEPMVSCMIGEPFHSFGTHIDRKMGAYCGWVAHKGSFAERMPLWNGARDISVIFAGEDLSNVGSVEASVVAELANTRDRSQEFVRLYEEQGPRFVEALGGWFCGVVIDRRRREVSLFNDRYGLGRVYVYEDARAMYFSSEAKSLLRVLPKLRSLDQQSAAEMVSFGCVLGNRTLFTGISLLPGASFWTIDYSGVIHKTQYFVPRQWEDQNPLTAEDYISALSSAVREIVPRYFRGPRQIGMSLTGGVDGRLIMSWAARPPEELPCYTFGSSYRETADVRIAREVAGACHQRHETIVVGESFLADFPKYAEKAIWVSDGSMDVTGSAELYANGIARTIAPIRVTGNYGSEILRGLIAFRPRAPLEGLYDGAFEERIAVASHAYEAECVGHPLSFIAFKQVPWHHYSRLAIEQSQLTLRSPYLDAGLVSLLYRAPSTMTFRADVIMALIAQGNPILAGIPTDRGLRAHSTTVLDIGRRWWQEFITKAEYAYDYGMPQWLVGVDFLLRSMRPERLILGRQKFCHFRIWYRDRLADYVQQILLDDRSRARPYICKEAMEKVVSSHIRGVSNYTLEINKLLSLELLQRTLIETQW